MLHRSIVLKSIRSLAMERSMDNAKVWDKDAVQHLIATNNAALAKALWNIYQRQTASEQSALTTLNRNGVGFNSNDAKFLSDVARRLPAYEFNMTPRQIARVRPMMRKYWRQLLEEIAAKGGAVCLKAPKRTIGKNPSSQPALMAETEGAAPCETAPASNRSNANPLFGAWTI
jgi:hypothetical protein